MLSAVAYLEHTDRLRHACAILLTLYLPKWSWLRFSLGLHRPLEECSSQCQCFQALETLGHLQRVHQAMVWQTLQKDKVIILDIYTPGYAQAVTSCCQQAVAALSHTGWLQLVNEL